MQEVKLDNLELFYDVLDESNNLLYEILRKPYFELFEETVNNILAGEVTTDLEDPKDAKKLKKIYKKLDGVDFSVEDVRKALQSIILRGFKEMNIPNGNTTPDTIGIFFSYLITKLTNKKDIAVLDPLCGTGNLLFTINNHLDKNLNLFACDNDYQMTKITSLCSDLLHTEMEIFYQDTLTLGLANMDIIVCDMPHKENNDSYFAYDAILHYKKMLSDGGSIITMVENDFFDYDKDSKFKKELLSDCSIVGLIELPDDMFKASKPKIILIISKEVVKDRNCFMVKLPNFSDASMFNSALVEIEAWFEKNKLSKK